MAQTPNEERKTPILTGASRGIGHATVKRFSAAGWRVITCSRHGFPENCPWEAGPEDHIQVDLADADDTIKAVAVMRERLKVQGGRLHALVSNAGISPKGDGGRRLSTIETDHRAWMKVFQVNFFDPILLARGLIAELEAASGTVVNVTSIAGSRVHPFAGLGLCYLESGARRAHPRDGCRLRAPRHQGERDRAGGDRHVDAVAGHRAADRRHSDAAAWAPRGGGQGDLFPLHRAIELHQRRGAPYRRRPACVSC
jgi:NAD(P)-dependent dehydrogenase (short-subunit alcohol dehydrogenase family)